jgi:hypothetical protein
MTLIDREPRPAKRRQLGVRSKLTSCSVTLAVAVATPFAIAPATSAAATPNLPSAVNYLVTANTADGNTDGTTLSQDGYYESFPGPPGPYADWGLTIDGAFALAAAGTDNAVLAKVANFVENGTDGAGNTIKDYTATDPTQDEVNGTLPYISGGALGKEALLAEVVGENPRNFGGQDLISLLDQSICTGASASGDYPVCAAAGNYYNSYSTLSQALGIMAQLRAGHPATAASPIAYLESQQEASGAWPSEIPSTGDSDPDSTAMAVMALAIAPGRAAATAVAKGQAWLASDQNPDGGWTGAAGDSTSSAALAVMALALNKHAYASNISRGLSFLASQQNTDGGFNVAAGQSGSDVRATTQVVSGIVGTSFATLSDRLSRAASRASAPLGHTPSS